ncbi:hypothetical protein FS837_001602, partial [Tulasnella sp. UAMH 9824]
VSSTCKTKSADVIWKQKEDCEEYTDDEKELRSAHGDEDDYEIERNLDMLCAAANEGHHSFRGQASPRSRPAFSLLAPSFKPQVQCKQWLQNLQNTSTGPSSMNPNSRPYDFADNPDGQDASPSSSQNEG